MYELAVCPVKRRSRPLTGSRPAPINDAICSGDNDIISSTASIWETAIKGKTGRLAFPLGLLPEILHRMD